MCHFCLVSERSFLRNLWVFLQKGKKNQKNRKSGVFFALIVAIFQGIQNIENGNPEGKSQLI